MPILQCENDNKNSLKRRDAILAVEKLGLSLPKGKKPPEELVREDRNDKSELPR